LAQLRSCDCEDILPTVCDIRRLQSPECTTAIITKVKTKQQKEKKLFLFFFFFFFFLFSPPKCCSNLPHSILFPSKSLPPPSMQQQFPPSQTKITITISSFRHFLISLFQTSMIPVKSVLTHLVRSPIFSTTRQNVSLSFKIFAISGKCQPYHSRARIAYLCKRKTNKTNEKHNKDVSFFFFCYVRVELLVQIVEQSNSLNNHRVHFVGGKFEFVARQRMRQSQIHLSHVALSNTATTSQTKQNKTKQTKNNKTTKQKQTTLTNKQTNKQNETNEKQQNNQTKTDNINKRHKQNKTKQNKTQHNTTKQNKTQHNKTQQTQHNTTKHNKYNTTQQNTTKHNTTQQNTTKHNKTKQNKTKQNTTQHNKTQQNTTQHNKTQQNTTKQNKTKQNKTKHNTTKKTNIPILLTWEAATQSDRE
jgi:hypothetical protein